MTDNRAPDMALLPGERAMSAIEWAEYGGLPPTMKAYCHRLIRDEAEIRRRQRIDELEAAEWRARSMRAVDRLGAAEQRAEAAEQRAAAAEQRGREAERARIAAEIAALGAEPDLTGQRLMPRLSPATRATLRDVAQIVAAGGRLGGDTP